MDNIKFTMFGNIQKMTIMIIIDVFDMSKFDVKTCHIALHLSKS